MAIALSPSPARVVDRAPDWRPASPWPALALLGVFVALLAVAAFADGATNRPAATWIQFGLLLAAGAGTAAWLFGASLRPAAAGAGWIGLGLLVAYAAWTGASIAWSVAPDRSWTDLNRAVAYVLAAGIGILAGASSRDVPRRFAQAYVGLALLVALYALGGKVAPGIHIDGLIDLNHTAGVSRLRAPLNYWNALALFTVFAVPLTLLVASDPGRRVRDRLAALSAVLLLLTVLGLTYSRGGFVSVFVGLGLLLLVAEHRWRAVGMLFVAAFGTMLALLFAFTKVELTTNALPVSVRDGPGAVFGLEFLVILVLTLLFGRLAIALERRLPWNAERQRRVRRVVAIVAGSFLALSVLNTVATGSLTGVFDRFSETRKDETTDPNRLLSTNSGNRWTWWKEAVGAWWDAPVRGHGAGSFPITHLQYRKDTLSVQQPHSVPLQWLAETGLVGLLLAVGALLALLAAAIARVRRESDPGRRALLGALLAIPVMWVVHSVIDWDWDFPAVTLPALFVAGMLAARTPAPGRRTDMLAGGGARSAALAGALVLLLGAALSAGLPELSERLTDRTINDLGSHPSPQRMHDAAADLELAARLDPTSVEPLYAASSLAERRGLVDDAREQLLRAIDRQPENPATHLRLVRLEFARDDRPALRALSLRALELDPMNNVARALASRVQSASTPPAESATATGTPLPRVVPVVP